MLRQIRYVLATYTGHRMAMTAMLFAAVFIILPNLFGALDSTHGSDRSAQAMTTILGMPLFFLMPFLVGHVKTQFCHPRARLTPNFNLPHIATVAGILLVLLVLFPSILAAYSGFPATGLMAVAFAIAAPAVWGIHLSSWIWMLLSIGSFYSLLTTWGTHWWVIDAAQHQLAHAAIIAIGCCLIVAWMVRLTYLFEELPDYQRTMQWSSSRRSGGEVAEQRRIIAQHVGRSRFITWASDFWLSTIGSYHGNDPFRIARLLRFGFNAQPIELTALFMATWFLAISLFLSELSAMQQGGVGTLWFLVQMSIIMPGVWAGQALIGRQPRMAMELTRPLGRQQYFDNLLLAAAWNTAIGWLMFNIALTIAAVRTIETAITPAMAGMFVLISTSIAVAAYGIAVRTAVWKSIVARLAALLIGSIAMMLPIGGWWLGRVNFGDAPFLAVAVVLLGLGAALIASARRVWANVEFA